MRASNVLRFNGGEPAKSVLRHGLKKKNVKCRRVVKSGFHCEVQDSFSETF